MFKIPEYIIGLFCAGQYSGNYIGKLLQEVGIHEKEVTGFRFRDKSAGGWPGNLKISIEEKSFFFDSKVRHTLKPAYELYRCLFCFDQLNIFSDISVGDPWGVLSKTDKAGSTVIIVRTEKGKTLVEDAQRDKIINVEPLDVARIIEGQKVNGRLKTQFFTSMSIAAKRNYNLPFASKSFEGILYRQAGMIEKHHIAERLYWSKFIFLEKEIEKYQKAIEKKILTLKRRSVIKKLLKKTYGVARFLIKRILG